MIQTEFLKNQAVLTTPDLRLEQLSIKHFEGLFAGINEPESRRLTGTHTIFTPQAVQDFLEKLPSSPDRTDWAIIRESDNVFLGEVVLNDLNADNQNMNFRIALGQKYLGQGYGTQATRAVIDYGFDMVKLHRISLGVLAFNPRAKRVYEKCGFAQEGIERHALLWDGQWVDQIIMSVLATDPRGKP
jgi:RimJ/RimL family protein N-acetyltransferase